VGLRGDAGLSAEPLTGLPPVNELAAALDAPHAEAVAAARRAIDQRRRALLAGETGPVDLVAAARVVLAQMRRPSLRRVINATGVILHTNLGRAPLPAAARAAVAHAAEGYSNLELDLETGARGSRHAHVEGLLRELTGAESAMVVNNGAAAVLLAAAALAGAGRSIVVSRGQLVEIGGGFRIPDVIAQSGSRLVEVGTTNRTQLGDYERAIEDQERARPAAILRVHQSNFRTVGFVADVSVEQLCGLGVPVIDDVGSGVVAQGLVALGNEPSLHRSVAAGAALVCCSGDKLLGGPQAGLLLGSAAAVAAARSHPLARALRIDKLSLAALEATLALYRDPARARREIPVLAMLDAGDRNLTRKAQALQSAIGDAGSEIVQATAKAGGGALPLLELHGPAVAISERFDPVAVATALRASDPPVIGRIHHGRLLLDPRTLADHEVDLVARVVTDALHSAAPG
jgi:L-seryl-tRNA(Ser) seleniumtransferase